MFAFLVRLLGIGWGLPHEFRNQTLHPDELVVFIYSQEIDPLRGDFDPGFYNYGTFYLTVLNVATKVVQGYSGMPDAANPWPAIASYHLAGRLISALAGAGIAWCVVAMLWGRTHPWGSAFGGLVVALSPGLVMHSRFQTVDMLATLFTALSLVYALKLVPADWGRHEVDPRVGLRFAALAGLFAGLSGGTKYSGVLALFALVGACTFLAGSMRWRALGVGVLVCVLAFFLTTPGALINPDAFWKDFVYELEHTSTGHGLVFAATSSGFLYHVANLAAGTGPILVLLCVAGMAAALARKKPWALPLALFFLVIYVTIGRAEVKFYRYVLPLVPPLAVAGGWLLGQAHTSPDRRRRLIALVGIVGLGGVGGGGLAGTGQVSLWMAGKDPRDEAGEALREQGEGKVVAIPKDPWFWSANVVRDQGLLNPNDRLAALVRTANPRVIRHVAPDGSRPDWSPEVLSERPDFVTYSSFESDDAERILRAGSTDRDATNYATAYEQFMDALEADYELGWVYGLGGPTVHDLMYVRPRVYVWKRKDALPSASTSSSTNSQLSAEPAGTP